VAYSKARTVDSVYISLHAIVGTLKKISKGEIPNTKSKTVSEVLDEITNVLNNRVVDFSNIVKQIEVLNPKQSFDETKK